VADLLSRSDEDERWLDFYATARALVAGQSGEKFMRQ
jgi:hypothetical protein